MRSANRYKPRTSNPITPRSGPKGCWNASMPRGKPPVLKILRGAANAFGVLLFALLFLVFVVQVVARFGFNQPLAWTDEAAVILYLWAILWGAALVCQDRENVAFDPVSYTHLRAHETGRNLVCR